MTMSRLQRLSVASLGATIALLIVLLTSTGQAQTATGGIRGTVTDAAEAAIPVPAKAGEVLLIHTQLWHRSGVNRTDAPRRGLTVCYMSAETRCRRKRRAPRSFVRVFEPKGP